MKPRGYVETFGDLVEVYPDHIIREQLAQTFWLQLERVLQELEVLMWHYRTQVDEEVYELEKAGQQLVEAWLATEANDVRTLERSLKYLLRRRQALLEAKAAGA